MNAAGLMTLQDALDRIAELEDELATMQARLASYEDPPEPEQRTVDTSAAVPFVEDEIEFEPLAVEHAMEWAREHADRSYRRPKGKVIYTVTGQTADSEPARRFGWSNPTAVLVRRSSDGRFSPYFPADLEAMLDVTEQEVHDV